MKDKLIKVIREVPIADKTYSEYVEAVADRLQREMDVRYIAHPNGKVELIPWMKLEEIFKGIETHSHVAFINGDEDTPMLLVDYDFYQELKKKYEVTENG